MTEEKAENGDSEKNGSSEKEENGKEEIENGKFLLLSFKTLEKLFLIGHFTVNRGA